MEGKSLLIVLAGVAICAFLPGSIAQIKLEFCGRTEFPSLKCAMNPSRFDLDVKNRTLCFCVMIQGVIPTYNCIKADGKVTIDDLRELAETIRNMTQFLRPSTTSTAAPPPEQTDLPPPEEEPVDDNEAGEGVGDEPTAPTEPARAPFFAKFPNVFRF